MTREKIIIGVVGLISFIGSFILIQNWKIWLGVWLFIWANNLGLEIKKL